MGPIASLLPRVVHSHAMNHTLAETTSLGKLMGTDGRSVGIPAHNVAAIAGPRLDYSMKSIIADSAARPFVWHGNDVSKICIRRTARSSDALE